MISINMADNTFDWREYKFESGVSDPKLLKTQPGIYMVYCMEPKQLLLDLGEAIDVQARVTNHDRKDCWEKKATGKIYFAAHYMPGAPEQTRRDVEGKLRRWDSFVCGER